MVAEELLGAGDAMDQIIPLTAKPNQAIDTLVSVDGKNLRLKLFIRYNTVAGYWVMSVGNISGILVDSIPLLTGNYPAANILSSFPYLVIGSAYIINAGGVLSDYPDDTNLGSDFVLVWGDTP